MLTSLNLCDKMSDVGEEIPEEKENQGYEGRVKNHGGKDGKCGQD